MSDASEDILGLNPRDLLARGAQRVDLGAVLRAWNPPDLVTMATLFPQYEVLAFLGRGGMGAVYRARQPHLDRLVAIKLLPGEAAADDAFAARFQAEARSLARLQHSNIVTIHDYGQTSAGHLFFVMEHVEGADLARMIETHTLQPTQALEIVSQICDALQYAHEQGIIHRDIKPANVLVARDGRVKVADFGLARLRDEADTADARLTQTGTVVGTPDYMAPEQRDGRALDQRADIYSLGVLFYEMLTGTLPRGAWEPPSHRAQTDPRLDEVVTKAMQAEPERRYQQASEVRSRVDQIRTSPARHSGWSLLYAAIALLCVGTGWWVWLGDRNPATEASSTPGVNPREKRGNAGTQFDPFTRLDLSKNIVSGDWQWLDGKAGWTLVLPKTSPDSANRLRLPIWPDERGYVLTFGLYLEDADADAGVILIAGKARFGLLLNVSGVSGLGLVRNRFWNENETSTRKRLPVRQPMVVEVVVHPERDQAHVMVRIDQDPPLIEWQGNQDALTLYEEPPKGWALPDRHALGFASFRGGIKIRDVRVRVEE